jgi:predicted AAA+ superfamily ATPase
MFSRHLSPHLEAALADYPAVVLLGARQVGKTTLARKIGDGKEPHCIYLDLERPSDLQKLTDPEAYLSLHPDKLVILDEVQHMPELFAVFCFWVQPVASYYANQAKASLAVWHI